MQNTCHLNLEIFEKKKKTYIWLEWNLAIPFNAIMYSIILFKLHFIKMLSLYELIF